MFEIGPNLLAMFVALIAAGAGAWAAYMAYKTAVNKEDRAAQRKPKPKTKKEEKTDG